MLCPLIAIFAALMPLPAHGQIPDRPLNVPATLEAETATPAPGRTVTLAFHFKPRPTWHGYWENPGDAGFGMTLDWTLPAGVSAGKPRYPVPEPLIISGLMNHVFERDYAMLVDLTLSNSIAAEKSLPVRVRGDWLSCTDQICVPEGGNLAIDLVTGDGRVKAIDRSRFDAWRAALPVPMDREARYAIVGKTIEIAIPFARGALLDRPYFFAKTEKLFRYAAPQSARRSGDWLVITGEVSGAFGQPIEGVLRIGDGQGLIVRAMPGAIPTGGSPIPVLGVRGAHENLQTTINFGWILGFSVLGGLLLNLMPCVFPILGLKALSLAKMSGGEAEARREALAYTSGVFVSCLALGGILLALRAGGQEVGWAFQLQEPAIVMLLLLLMVAVTTNLAGLFEIGSIGAGGALTRQGGMGGSFWTGVLAAVVATPCTGPFMAAAMGAALLLPVEQALLLFAGLGFGLALPFLGIAYVPALRRILPKPGPWLDTFRKAMAVPMALTAAALLWLLWRLVGDIGLIVGGVAASVIAALLLLYGRLQRRGGSSLLAVLACIAVAVMAALLVPREAPTEATATDLANSQPFSEKRLAALRATGTPVFVYFTADWCVTCKINEATAINRRATVEAFAKAGIITLKGDFTRRDPAITRFLARNGRSGVPLYLYYPADGDAQILPQILTVETLTNLAK